MAESTLKEIISDNARLRQTSNCSQVEKKIFEIELQETLCRMRSNTQLVIVDIPGINEARISDKYKNWVSNNWDTFDCAIVVMDGKHGVNTDTQVG
jgi:predicted GTPase